MDTLSKKLAATALCGVARTLSVALGLHAVFAYEIAPGAVGKVSQTWSASSQIGRVTDQSTLVMLAHPQRPCRRASVAELVRIMVQTSGKMDAYVPFWEPTGSDWNESGLRRGATAIPGVKVLSDADGIEAKRFGAQPSGPRFLFDGGGRVRFSGGIRGSHGHEGQSAGERAIISMISNGTTACTATFACGCSLINRDEGKL